MADIPITLSLIIRDNHREWKEDHGQIYGDPHEEVIEWAKDLVAKFNRRLRPGETPRDLVAVRLHCNGVTEEIWREE